MGTVDASWSAGDLAKAVCDELVAKGLLKEKPAFIRSGCAPRPLTRGAPARARRPPQGFVRGCVRPWPDRGACVQRRPGEEVRAGLRRGQARRRRHVHDERARGGGGRAQRHTGRGVGRRPPKGVVWAHTCGKPRARARAHFCGKLERICAGARGCRAICPYSGVSFSLPLSLARICQPTA